MLIYAIAFFVAKRVRKYALVLDDKRITDASHPVLRFIANCGNLMFPLTAIVLLRVSAHGIVRVAIFGSLLFWLGRTSNRTGREILNRQTELHQSTREVASKLFEVATFVVIVLLLLNVMGINLTALAVFGGALGVGLDFGLQAIASNFISGLIILFDRSVTVDVFVELEGGRAGIVPNEKLIVETFINWTHKNKRQRYRVDFSVAHSRDIDQLVVLIKRVVASHPKVLSGEELPIEYRPDCGIASFGDSGVNMFVEFWMEGIDDGKNRVGGDLLLMIFNALREHGFEILFPQREVRVLNPSFNVGPLQKQGPERA